MKKNMHICAIVMILVIALLNGCMQSSEDKKSHLQEEFLMSILAKKCNNAQIAYEEMLKLDPQDQYPLMSYEKPDPADLEAVFQNSAAKTREANREMDNLNKKGIFNIDEPEESRVISKVSRIANENIDSFNNTFYANKFVIEYDELNSSLEMCNQGNYRDIPFQDYKKALKMRRALNR